MAKDQPKPPDPKAGLPHLGQDASKEPLQPPHPASPRDGGREPHKDLGKEPHPSGGEGGKKKYSCKVDHEPAQTVEANSAEEAADVYLKELGIVSTPYDIVVTPIKE